MSLADGLAPLVALPDVTQFMPMSGVPAGVPALPTFKACTWSVLANCAAVGAFKQRAPQVLRQVVLSLAGAITPNTRAEEQDMQGGLRGLLQAGGGVQTGPVASRRVHVLWNTLMRLEREMGGGEPENAAAA